MKISDACVPVAGATGALGGAFLAELVDRGARPALAGRGAGRLRRVARDCPGAPVVTCDAYAPDSRARTAHDSASEAADHSASEAAPSAWLRAVRREKRSTGVRALDICPGPLETGFAGRAVAGTAAPMPPGGDPRQVAGAVADALETDAGLLRTDPDGTPAVEGRAR
ncbi:hypothetical protein PUR34_18615 [Streptomyces sp. JV185]|uniref:hypothetical protein n=1 Tax=Streptomyces sp. JV185 TaxID=858638 RepID=UPI002E762B7C|nr:hypothetical protein [Streptomyces sp. JV185]MEE1770105.1 hypothetical protein [Streptomyces sp. JV185]